MNWACRAAAIADAWTNWLNDGNKDWQKPSQQFTAGREWASDKKLEEIDNTLYAGVVVFAEGKPEVVARNKKSQPYSGLLILAQHYEPPGTASTAAIPNAWIDNLVATLEAIQDALDTLTVTYQLGGQPANFQVWAKEPPELNLTWLEPALLNNRSFLGFLSVTFTEVRPR